MKPRNLRLLAGTSVLALVGALLSAEVVGAEYACAPTAPLISAENRSTRALAVGVQLGQANFLAGQSNSGNLPTRVTWAQGSLSSVNFVAPSAKTGETTSQYQMAANSSSLAWINTDFYNEGTRFPYNAMLRNGELIYAPNRSTNVVASALTSYSKADGYPATSYLRSGSLSLLVSGVNTGQLSSLSGVTLVTAEASMSTVPLNQAAILVSNGKVVKVFAKGFTQKPRYGLLFIARGIHASKLRALKVGVAVSFRVPAVPSGHQVMVADHIWAYGLVQVGDAAVRIRTVNSDSLSPTAANLYDSNYSANRTTLQGKYTLVVDSNSNLTAKYWGGRAMAVPAGGKVIQLGSDGIDVYKAATVGATITVKNEYLSRSGLHLINATGRGAELLAKDKVIQVCYPRLEEIRPRTAIGWNNATGKIWFLTSSSGLNLTDFGFRSGGSTVRQAANWLHELGATDAVMVDGGGSTTFIAKINGSYKRQDIPDEAWIREVPIGAALVPKD